MKKPLFSIVIPAYNEEENISPTLKDVSNKLRDNNIPFEIIVVNDNSQDSTEMKIKEFIVHYPEVKLISRKPPGGFGRAIRTGLENIQGDFVTIVMADLSDDSNDIVKYYYKLLEGADCVFGTRFHRNSTVKDYPLIKLIVNRIVNKLIQLIFATRCNDLTNAFKAYNARVIRDILPLKASHFNITIELSLSALIRGYKIETIPINWYGRKWGASNLKLRAMGRRYFATLLKILIDRVFILDDLLLEKESNLEDVQRY